MISKKHKQKILGFFSSFAKNANEGRRIRVRGIQKMLGLQIWISTVFRIARQFLTSLCDVLRSVLGPNDEGPRGFSIPGAINVS